MTNMDCLRKYPEPVAVYSRDETNYDLKRFKTEQRSKVTPFFQLLS